MTGRRNRAQAPRGSSPRAPLLRLAFYMDYKNWIAKILSRSEQPQNSVRTSLVPLSICLREVLVCSFGFFEAAQAKESWGGGEEKLRRLRWSSSPREQAHYRECDKV